MRNYSKIYEFCNGRPHRIDFKEMPMSEIRKGPFDIMGVYYIPRDAKMAGL